MKHIKKVALVFIVIFSICQGKYALPSSRVKAELSKATSDFTFNLYREVSKQYSSNIFLSPLGISTALTLLYQGARGRSGSQLRNALQYKNMTISNINQAYKTLNNMLNQPNENYTLKFASKMYLQDNIDLQEEFINILDTFYAGELEQIDFRKPKLAKQNINNWASDKTNGKIPTIINTLSPSTLLVILNAVYFKGNWMYYFYPSLTEDHQFTTSSETIINVPMMSQSGKFKYGEDHDVLGCKVIELPYSGKEISMFILLPNSFDGLSELESNLNSQSLQYLINNMTEQTVRPLKIPKFKLEAEYELKPMLKQLGIRNLFENADLSGMLDNYQGGISVSNVLHKTYIEVNEKGSEAAAVTAVIATKSMNSEGIRKQFVADHPFIFLIRENRSNVILFIGRYGTESF